jgi:SAM-dependent methyltransferase
MTRPIAIGYGVFFCFLRLGSAKLGSSDTDLNYGVFINVSYQCLVVQEAGVSNHVPNCFQMEISFNSNVSGREITPTEASDSRVIVTLSEDYRPIRGEFDEQILNRFFTEQFLRIRPRIVIISLVCGASLDLIRLAKIFGAVVIAFPSAPELMPSRGSRAFAWLLGALSSADALVCADQESNCQTVTPTGWKGTIIGPDQISGWIDEHEQKVESVSGHQFDYGLYEFGLRDHALLREMQRGALTFFQNSKRVLDLASGAGIFLDLLEGSGINAEGVERNPALVKYSRDIGFRVHEADAFDYLKTVVNSKTRYDGIHCSHFVEHLPIAAVEELIYLLYAALDEDGVLVLIFPDPESIRSQLLGFWRDPEHVRFYHPELIEIMARAVGFEPVYSNQRANRRDVISFPQHMKAWPELSADGMNKPEKAAIPKKWWNRLFNRQSMENETLKQEIARLHQRIQTLEDRSLASERTANTLWTINQTWAWDDNATLCLRKPKR